MNGPDNHLFDPEVARQIVERNNKQLREHREQFISHFDDIELLRIDVKQKLLFTLSITIDHGKFILDLWITNEIITVDYYAENESFRFDSFDEACLFIKNNFLYNTGTEETKSWEKNEQLI